MRMVRGSVATTSTWKASGAGRRQVISSRGQHGVVLNPTVERLRTARFYIHLVTGTTGAVNTRPHLQCASSLV